MLESPQGQLKSTMLRILGGSFFTELPFRREFDRDVVDVIRSRWIVEFSELEALRRAVLEALRRADVSAIKWFLPRQVDRVRLAYARRTSDHPRRCVFVGTTNDRPIPAT